MSQSPRARTSLALPGARVVANAFAPGLQSRRFASVAGLLRVGVGAFLLLGVGAKVFLGDGLGATYGVTTFAAVIAGHNVIPTEASYVAAVVAIALELSLGVWLLAQWQERAATGASLAAIAALSLYVGVAYARVGDAPCGCLGRLTASTLTGALLRNAGLVGLLLPTLCVSRRQDSRSLTRRSDT